ncbi:MAG: glutathione S-transferase family protein [Alphaproteobacteria bacterium]|jgi:glutathione S-transferase
MTDFTLHIGNKNYSSWSLRGWLACKLAGIDFRENRIQLDVKGTAAAIAAVSPNRRVPCLEHGDVKVWDSLAIAEYLNELKPDAAMWPERPAARAVARSMVAEMHSSYMGLRNRCPMDIRGEVAPISPPAEVQEDLVRLEEAWNYARSTFGAAGPYLFGRWTLADAFFAPVASRCKSYGLPLSEASQAYVTAVLEHPDVVQWTVCALNEDWRIPHEDAAEQRF